MKGKVALWSILVNLILAAGKVIVGILTNSASVLAEGIHSGMDIFSSGISLIGIKTAKKPVDKEHPYGHYKFEVLSGLFITLILFVTGIWIIYEAYRRFLRPLPLEFTYLALAIMLFSAVINEIVARMKIHYGKKEVSISLLSDGVHSRIDVYTSLAVMIGLILTRYWVHADSLLALVIGLYIIKESFSLGKESTDSLLDISAGEEVENRIKEIVRKENIELSELKTQKKGSAITANLKIRLPGKLKVDEATVISNKLKKQLVNGINRLEYVAVQIESHDISTGSFRLVEPVTGTKFGRGVGWQRRGKFKETMPESRGFGPDGYCLCEKCGHKV